MKNTEKLGEYKVRIHFKKPFPAALEFLSGGLSILPAGIWETARKDSTGKPDYGTVAPIGTGPAPSREVTVCKGILGGGQPASRSSWTTRIAPIPCVRRRLLA